MNVRSRVLLSLGTSLLVAMLGAGTALATTSYGTINGTNVDFIDIEETSQTGDPEPLFGAPTLTGPNQITFFPATFTATAIGPLGFDQTGALLNMTIMGASPLDVITEVRIDEFGDVLFAGAGGAGTNTLVTMSGNFTVLEDTGGAITPVVIPITATFTPNASGAFDIVNDGVGSTNWEGNVSIDVASAVPNATKGELQFNNFLFAFSEGTSSATIQKKVEGAGVVITVIPEPTTGALLLAGLVAFGFRSRHAHRQGA